MEWLKLLLQRRIIGSALFAICGFFGIHGAQDQMQMLLSAVLGFAPAAMNLLSYFKGASISWRPELVAGLVPVAAAIAKALGVPVPDEVIAAVVTSGMGIVAATLSIVSSFSTNKIQPSGALASPNP